VKWRILGASGALVKNNLHGFWVNPDDSVVKEVVDVCPE
jgi:hypothetical protein